MICVACLVFCVSTWLITRFFYLIIGSFSPTVFSLLPSSFAPFIISLCLQSCASLPSNGSCLVLPCQALLHAVLFCPYGVVLFCLFLSIKRPSLYSSESSPHPTTQTLTNTLVGLKYLPKFSSHTNLSPC